MNACPLEREIARIKRRPTEPPIHLLATIEVKPLSTNTGYAQRLRELLHATLEICKEADFDEEDVPTSSLPGWFLSVTNGEQGDPSDSSPGALSKVHYVTVRTDRPWDAEDWIYCFDPELRTWSWWDVAEDERGNIHVWIDTNGEAHVPCEELWWAIYVAGAEEAGPLTLEPSSQWHEQASLGTSDNGQ